MGVIQGSINAALSAVGNTIDTAAELKERKKQVAEAAKLAEAQKATTAAQEATTAELKKQAEERDLIANARQRISAAEEWGAEAAEDFKKERAKKKYNKQKDPDSAAWQSVIKKYRENENRLTEFGYLAGLTNQKTGKEYSLLEYTLARQELAMERTGVNSSLNRIKSMWAGTKINQEFFGKEEGNKKTKLPKKGTN